MRIARDPGALHLAFDTSGAHGSVALGTGSSVLAEVELTRRGEHAARLVPAIQEALDSIDRAVRDVAGIVVGEGPGSFTGVRVAAATAKGLAGALGIPLWAVSSLAAAALAREVGSVRYVLFDARADRVYAACYGVGRTVLETLCPPRATTLRDVLGSDVPAGATFVGDGADRHRAAIESLGFPVAPPPTVRPTGAGLLAFLHRSPRTDPVGDVGAWEPRYLRATGAEREWNG